MSQSKEKAGNSLPPKERHQVILEKQAAHAINKFRRAQFINLNGEKYYRVADVAASIDRAESMKKSNEMRKQGLIMRVTFIGYKSGNYFNLKGLREFLEGSTSPSAYFVGIYVFGNKFKQRPNYQVAKVRKGGDA